MEIRLIEEEDYFPLLELIERNRERLITYFPKTLEAITHKASAQEYVKQKIQQAQNKEFYFFVLPDHKTNALLGCLMAKNIEWSVPKCELAYFIDEIHEGKGFTSKALEALVDFSFEKLGMEKLYLRIDPLNEGSKRVAIKNGFVQEGLLKREYRNGKGMLTDVEYFGRVKHVLS